jgi:hypothetical protein
VFQVGGKQVCQVDTKYWAKEGMNQEQIDSEALLWANPLCEKFATGELDADGLIAAKGDFLKKQSDVGKSGEPKSETAAGPPTADATGEPVEQQAAAVKSEPTEATSAEEAPKKKVKSEPKAASDSGAPAPRPEPSQPDIGQPAEPRKLAESTPAPVTPPPTKRPKLVQAAVARTLITPPREDDFD